MNTFAQRPDLEAQKQIWRQMVADTAVVAKSTTAENPDSLAGFRTPGNYSDGTWGLHQGLNVNVDLSAFATFGGHLPHRGGFSQTLEATYLAPLTKDGRLWMMGGGYLTHLNYGSEQYANAGLYALLDYQFDEHWEAYIYGQLSLTGNGVGRSGRGFGPYGGYYYGSWDSYPLSYGSMGPGMMNFPNANVIGAGAIYHPSKNFSIGFQVESAWFPNSSPRYFDQYNYPSPKD